MQYTTMEIGDKFSVMCSADEFIRIRNNAHSAIIRRGGAIMTERTSYGFIVTLTRKPENR